MVTSLSPSQLGSFLPLRPVPGKRFLEHLCTLPPGCWACILPKASGRNFSVRPAVCATPGPNQQQGGVSSCGHPWETSDLLWAPGGQESSPTRAPASAGTSLPRECDRCIEADSHWGEVHLTSTPVSRADPPLRDTQWSEARGRWVGTLCSRHVARPSFLLPSSKCLHL